MLTQQPVNRGIADSNLALRRIAADELCDRIGEKAVEPLKQLLSRGDVSSTQTVHALWALTRLTRSPRNTRR